MTEQPIPAEVEALAIEHGAETIGDLRHALSFRCFHCLRAFSGAGAYQHFGLVESESPACVSPSPKGGG